MSTTTLVESRQNSIPTIIEKASPDALEQATTLCSNQGALEPLDPGPPPDGGTRAWLQMLVGHMMNILTSGYWSSFGIYQLYYVETLQLPPSQISWIGSIQMFLTFFLGTFSGRLADAGYARHTVLVGSFLLTLGTFMTSLATTYWQILLAQGVCAGIGMGILSIPTITVVGSYFEENKAMALGFCASGSGTGSIIWPLLLQNLQPRIGTLSSVLLS